MLRIFRPLQDIVDSFRFMKDKLTLRTKPLGSMIQTHWGMELASDIYADCHALNPQPGYKKFCGKSLYEALPHEMAPAVIRTWFDPYYKEMTKSEISDWLWAHVLFDGDGNIIAIHDRGEIFICEPEWAAEADWFSRAKMHREGYWTKANKEREKALGG